MVTKSSKKGYIADKIADKFANKKRYIASGGEGTDSEPKLDHNPLVFMISPLPSAFTYTFDSSKLNTVIRGITPYPQGPYGFHHFIHQSREKLSLTSIFKGKKKVYKIYDEFNENIDEHDVTIASSSLTYFKDNTTTLTKSFFKMWEILMTFDLFNNTKASNITSLSDDGETLRAISYFRKMFSTNSSDTYIVLNDKNNAVKSSKNITVHNGSIVDPSTSSLFGKTSNKMDVVIANFSTKTVLQEQEGFPVFVSQILYCFMHLNKGGCAVIKMYEMYTDITVKLLLILRKCFDHMYIYKPYTSVKTSPEKYVVLKNYNGFENAAMIKTFTSLRTASIEKKYVNDFFPDIVIPKHFKNEILTSNIELGNRTFKCINDIIGFINRENYRGDEYNERRNIQIRSTNFWIETFYSDKSYSEIQSVLQDAVEVACANNQKTADKFDSLIV